MIIHYAIITVLRITRDIPKYHTSSLLLRYNIREQFLKHLREVFPIYILSSKVKFVKLTFAKSRKMSRNPTANFFYSLSDGGWGGV